MNDRELFNTPELIYSFLYWKDHCARLVWAASADLCLKSNSADRLGTRGLL